MNTLLNQTFITHGEEETEALGARLAQAVPCGTVLALEGNLGAGKTVFARGFAHGLGIAETVSSPTYTIMQEYPIPDRTQMFFHLDLYRIDGARAALAFGVDEYLNDPDAYVLAEWPQRIAEILPPGTIFVNIRRVDENTREIRFENH